ncbi:hypothetical protein LguiB_002093 [Lonicera macranthoides]
MKRKGKERKGKESSFSSNFLFVSFATKSLTDFYFFTSFLQKSFSFKMPSYENSGISW